MADVATPNANQQVPLDTIPISPDGNASGETKASTNESNEGDIRTVFHDADNFNVKHPLMNTWTLWFTKPPSGKVCAISTYRLDSLANMTNTGRQLG